MDETQKVIENWCLENTEFVSFLAPDQDAFQMLLETGTTQKHTFQIFFENTTWAPMFISSNADALEGWVNRMNTFIQRRSSLSLVQLLEESRKSLLLLWKIDAPPPPSRVVSKPPSFDYASEFSGSFEGYGSAPMSIPTPPPPPEVEKETPKTAESIRDEVNQWIGDHTGVLELRNLDEDAHVISLSIGQPPMDFEVICDDNWNLEQVLSEHDDLKRFVPVITEYLATTKPSVKTFFNHFSLIFTKDQDNTEIKSIDQIRDALSGAASKLFPQVEEEAKVDPTEDDWEPTIFPAIHQYLTDDSMEYWQIEEWMRRVRLEFQKCSPGDYETCLEYILENVFNGGEPPVSIRKFFPKIQPSYLRRQERKWKYPRKATASARRILAEVLEHLPKADDRSHGYTVTPIGGNSFHWRISLFNFDPQSHIGQQLVNYTVSTGFQPELQFRPSRVRFQEENSSLIDPVDIVFELKFPTDFPNGSPLFRLIRPRLTNLEDDLFTFDFKSLVSNTTTDSNTTTNSVDSSTIRDQDTLEALEASAPPTPSAPEPSPAPAPAVPNPLSMSMRLEKTEWEGTKVDDFIIRLRSNIANSTTIEVDMNSSPTGIPTDGSFWEQFHAMPLSSVPQARPESEVGGKIYLPSQALSEIMGQDSGGYGYGYPFRSLRDSGGQSPMIFEISTKSGKRSFCGVMEFIAPEGCIGIPSWMMQHLGISPGNPVQVRKVRLPQGAFVQLQPHSADFHKVASMKAMLEWVLRRFVALAVGDTIQIEHDHVTHVFNVLKCSPQSAIAITDSELSVDFAQPLEGDVPPPSQKSKKQLTESQEIRREEKLNRKREEEEASLVRAGTMEHTPSGVEGVDYKVCSNCKHKLPIVDIMHELTCARRNWFCESCNVVVLKTEREKHLDEWHSPFVCEGCGDTMEKRFIVDHKKTNCPGRVVKCMYCQLKMQYRQLWSHERDCGSVTELCHKCNIRFARRELEPHTNSCTGKPSGLRDARPYTGYKYNKPRVRDRDEMMMCEQCSQPFGNFEDLQVHVLTVHANDLGSLSSLFGGTSTDGQPTSLESAFANMSLSNNWLNTTLGAGAGDVTPDTTNTSAAVSTLSQFTFANSSISFERSVVSETFSSENASVTTSSTTTSISISSTTPLLPPTFTFGNNATGSEPFSFGVVHTPPNGKTAEVNVTPTTEATNAGFSFTSSPGDATNAPAVRTPFKFDETDSPSVLPSFTFGSPGAGSDASTPFVFTASSTPSPPPPPAHSGLNSQGVRIIPLSSPTPSSPSPLPSSPSPLGETTTQTTTQTTTPSFSQANTKPTMLNSKQENSEKPESDTEEEEELDAIEAISSDDED